MPSQIILTETAAASIPTPDSGKSALFLDSADGTPKYKDDSGTTNSVVGATGATGATGPAGADGADGADGQGVPVGGTAGQVLAKIDGTDYNTEWVDQSGGGGGSGAVVQVVNTQTGAVATGSTVIPLDDTIPQNTEGDEYMTLSITPTSATNKLRIDVVVFATVSAVQWITAALFQDSTANALAAFSNYQAVGTAGNSSVFTHYMTAGTTSATTFKVRLGRDASAGGTVTFNGQGGGRLFGGVVASSITITEIVP